MDTNLYVKTAVDELGRGFSDFRTRVERDVAEVRDLAQAAKRDAEKAIIGAERQHSSVGAASPEQLRGLAIFVKSGDARELKAMTVGTAADGGYIVPEELAGEFLKVAKPLSPLRNLSRVYRASSGDFKIPISVGGTGATWAAETDTRSDSATPTIAEIAPPGGELFAVAKVSQWLLDDSKFNLEQWLVQEIGEQFAVTENTAFTGGNGTNKPKGILAYTTAATADSSRTWGQIEHLATGVAGDFAASNKGDKLIELTYKLKAAYRSNAVWQMPASVAAEIRQFRDSSGRYIWAESLAPGAPPMLLGYPVVENEDMPAKAANSLSIGFGDFKRAYGIVDREGMRMVRDPFTEKGHVKLYIYRRTYGALVDSNAVKLLKFAVS